MMVFVQEICNVKKYFKKQSGHLKKILLSMAYECVFVDNGEE
jgi:hypothetical protein